MEFVERARSVFKKIAEHFKKYATNARIIFYIRK